MKLQDPRLIIEQGDITHYAGDAIVNAANHSLLGGLGVDGAIHRAAGMRLRLYCMKLGGCKTGEAKITPGFRLPAKHIIHTVGPVYRGGSRGEPEDLARCYRSVLAVAAENQLNTIAFPAISCGGFGYPVHEAAEIALREIDNALLGPSTLKEVRIICFDSEVFRAYVRQ